MQFMFARCRARILTYGGPANDVRRGGYGIRTSVKIILSDSYVSQR